MIPIIQNVDRNVSQRDYADLGTKILVTSMFATIQGEGPYAGWPAMFLRLSGCNYGAKADMCQFCDTSFQFDKGTMYTPDELLQALKTQPGYNRKQILVITGGEPTLQTNLLSLIVLAQDHFALVQLETNGTQPKFFEEAGNREMRSCFKTVVSPKANMRLKKYPKLAMPAIGWWVDCFKFVMSADPESAHHEIPDWVTELRIPVYVSPMAVYLKPYEGEVSSIWDEGLIDKVATAANYKYTAEYAMKHNLIVSTQQHLVLGLA